MAPPPRLLLQHARLRPTDNGSALLEAGTIRGSRPSQRRFSSEKEHLMRHRLFHSDPDLSQGRGSSQSGRGYKEMDRDVRKSGRNCAANLCGSSEMGYTDRGHDGSPNGLGYSDVRQNGRDYTANRHSSTESGRSFTNNAGGSTESGRGCSDVRQNRRDYAANGHSSTGSGRSYTNRGGGSTESGRDYGTKGGVASARKIRQKKSRAPQPPGGRQDVAGACRCGKPRAPPPPPGATTRSESAGPGGYEKNVAPLEKWRVERPPPKFYFGQAASPPCSRPPSSPPHPASGDIRLLPRRPADWLCSSSDSACDWTPRQDLSDDDGSDEDDGGPAEVSFPQPAALFSNHRQKGRSLIDVGVASDSCWAGGDAKGRGSHRWASGRREGRGLAAEGDPNWTFGLSKHGRRYSSELLLSSRKRSQILDNFLLGDVLASRAGQMKTSSSDFSFYSTEGRVASEPLPLAKGRVAEIRRRFDANLSAKGAKQEEERKRRDMQLARMLEDEVRRRRNREKAGLREQLRRLDEEDEAYFTHTTPTSSRLGHAPLLRDTPPVWSSSPSPPPSQDDGVCERLMNIVRREERHLRYRTVSPSRPSPSPTPPSSSSGDSSVGEARQDGAKPFLQPYSCYRPVHFQHGSHQPSSRIEIS